MLLNLLILGGTTEAMALGQRLALARVTGTMSLAGRVALPKHQPLPQRVGGFGGLAGLVQYLRDHRITHIVDATHPFAAQMSTHAVAAAAQTGIPLIALTRPAWVPQDGDTWQQVPDIAGAVAALARPAQRVLLAVGRIHLDDFAPNPQHHYVIRLVDPPRTPPPFPNHDVIISRGPFTPEADLALLRDHSIDLIVSKNSGGTGARAKIDAARVLGLPVVMIARPWVPTRTEAGTPDEILAWIAHADTDLGV